MSDLEEDVKLSHSSSELEESQPESVNGVIPYLYEPSASEDDTLPNSNEEEESEDKNVFFIYKT
uniref:Uncharacterized protein n=1 Tax=Amphimedon queenslandica TaxID=400682 RepID=A0A1X7VJ51_AMPQE